MKATAEITNKTVTTPLQRDREGHCRDIAKRFVTVVLVKNLKKKINGVGNCDLRRNGGDWIVDTIGMGRSLVLEHKIIQRVRREESVGSDHFQCRFCFLLQSSPARSLRNHPYSLQRVSNLFTFHLRLFYLASDHLLFGS